MKRRKRFIASVMLIVFSISICPVFAFAAVPVDDFEQKMKDQQNAVEANKILMKNLRDENYEYPDYYGGVYIEDNILHIQIVNENSTAVASIETWLHNYLDWIEIENVNYSYNYLYDLATDTANTLLEEGKSVTGYHVDVTNNRSVVKVANEQVLSSIPNTASFSPEPSALAFEVQDYVTPDYAQKAVPTSENELNVASSTILKGGMRAYVPDNYFTIGVCGTYGSSDAFVTCGHGQDANSFTYLTSSSTDPIGGLAYLRYSNNGYGDFSIHDVTDSVVTTSLIEGAGAAGENILISGEYDESIAKGTYLVKYGYYGGRCECVVSDEVVALTPTYGIRILGLVEAEILEGTTTSGDSGGPYMWQSGEDWHIAGIHHGSDKTDEVDYVYFTPWVYISRAGFSI